MQARCTRSPGIDEPLELVQTRGTNYFEADGLAPVTSFTSW
jgi:hypothetical protein